MKKLVSWLIVSILAITLYVPFVFAEDDISTISTFKFMSDISEYSGSKFDNKHIRTSNGNYEYFDYLINGNLLTVTGYITNPKINKLIIDFVDKKDYYEKVHYGFRQRLNIKNNEEFKVIIDLSKYMKDFESTVNIWKGTNSGAEHIDYEDYITFKIKIEKIGNEYFIKKPLVYDKNKLIYSNNILKLYFEKLGRNNRIKDIEQEIVELSNSICENTKGDYDKVLKIHNWVAENIYYDYDYYNDKKNKSTYFSSIEVLKNKRTVCEGYSNLFMDLVRVQNIPCRKIHGYDIKTYRQVWTNEILDNNEITHAWNQVYVNNRWINVDVTWDSNNIYENGTFVYNGLDDHYYFDISDEMLSYSHKAMFIKLLE